MDNVYGVDIGKEKIKVAKLDQKNNNIKSLDKDKYKKLFAKNGVLAISEKLSNKKIRTILNKNNIENFNVETTIKSPFAAALYHYYKAYQKNKNYSVNNDNFLVFDFGKNTLDLSLVNIKKKDTGKLQYLILYSEVSEKLSGDVIDYYFLEYILSFINKNNNNQIGKYYTKYKSSIEKAKIKLTKYNEISLNFKKENKKTTISREDFEYKIMEEKYRLDFSDFIKNYKRKIGKGINKIDEILLVGGISNIPYIKKMIKFYFPTLKNNINVYDDCTNAIAKGAAIYGGILNNYDIYPFNYNKNNFLNSNIYIKEDDSNKHHLLLKKGTRIPFQTSKNINIKINNALKPYIKINIKKEKKIYSKRLNKIISESREVESIRIHHPFYYKGEDLIIKAKVDKDKNIDLIVKHKLTNEKYNFQLTNINHDK